MAWDEVVGHAAVKRSLQNAVEQGRVNHAYLFTGPASVGKFMIARAFAAAIVCGEGGCGECNACRKVSEEKHPDVIVVRPAGKNIPVETIREIRMSAFRKPVEAERKVYIIKEAERMWEEGASTLLKILEEPPANVVFILLTSNPSGLLPTIRSRCQEITFSIVPYEELSRHLVATKGVMREKADLIARLTGGVLGRALDWCDDPWRLELRDSVVNTARALRRADLNQTLELASGLHGQVKAATEEIQAAYAEKKSDLADGSIDDQTVRRLGKEFDEECKREQIKEEITGIKDILSTLAWWYRDILIWEEGADEGLLINIDLKQEIAEEAEALPLASLTRCIDLIGEGMRASEQNVPALLNIESTLMAIQEELYA